jgi:hypothetical protein
VEGQVVLAGVQLKGGADPILQNRAQVPEPDIQVGKDVRVADTND